MQLKLSRSCNVAVLFATDLVRQPGFSLDRVLFLHFPIRFWKTFKRRKGFKNFLSPQICKNFFFFFIFGESNLCRNPP